MSPDGGAFPMRGFVAVGLGFAVGIATYAVGKPKNARFGRFSV